MASDFVVSPQENITTQIGAKARPIHEYRADIDGLRAVAVISVVGFHAFPNLIKGGFIGVDIFFVISGYLITGIILNNLKADRFTFFDFYARRIKRIFPALAVVMTATLLFGLYELLPEDLRNLGRHLTGGSAFVSNLFLWQESGYFDTASITKPLLHLWSLGIEEQFYIFWPVILYVAYKFKRNSLAVALIIGLASFILNVARITEAPTATFYSPLSRCWELMIGAVLAQAPLHKFQRSNLWTNFSSLAGLTCLSAGFSLLSSTSKFPGWWAILPTVGTSLIIAAGQSAWPNKYILSNRIPLSIGLVSFPLYLWHWPILSFLYMAENGTPSDTKLVSAVAVSVLLATLTYLGIERPLRFNRNRPRLTYQLAVVMAVIGAVGWGIYLGNGIPTRFPKEIQQFAAFKFNFKPLWRDGSCFLNPEQDYAAFARCKAVGNLSGPTIYVWGDSHGAAIFPGFADVYGSKNRLIQRTASACAPLLGADISGRPNCKDINDQVFESIKREHPAEVILVGNWSGYDWAKVGATVKALTAIGVPHVILMGPVPQWLAPLKKEMYAYYRLSSPRVLPTRMTYGLNPYIPVVDKQMADLAKQINVPYVSPVDIMCNIDGCITRVGADAGSLTYFDYGHLTRSGADYLVSRIAGDDKNLIP